MPHRVERLPRPCLPAFHRARSAQVQGSERQKPLLHPSREGSRLQSAAARKEAVYRSAGGGRLRRFFENPTDFRVEGPWGLPAGGCFPADPTPRQPDCLRRKPFKTHISAAARCREQAKTLREGPVAALPKTPYSAAARCRAAVAVAGRDPL